MQFGVDLHSCKQSLQNYDFLNYRNELQTFFATL